MGTRPGPSGERKLLSLRAHSGHTVGAGRARPGRGSRLPESPTGGRGLGGNRGPVPGLARAQARKRQRGRARAGPVPDPASSGLGRAAPRPRYPRQPRGKVPGGERKSGLASL